MNLLPYLASLALATSLLGACSSERFPALAIPRDKPRDSLAQLSLTGDSLSMQIDSLRWEDDLHTLHPDTSLYKEALVVYAGGERLRYFRLTAGEWQEAEVPKPKAKAKPRVFPQFYALDVAKRKGHSLDELIRSRVLALTFADPSHRLITRDSLRALEKRFAKDSLKHVLLYLSPSDSLVRSRMKRDSLGSYLAFSDSLGEVSRLRDSLGIARSTKPQIFLVDSTRRIIQP